MNLRLLRTLVRGQDPLDAINGAGPLGNAQTVGVGVGIALHPITRPPNYVDAIQEQVPVVKPIEKASEVSQVLCLGAVAAFSIPDQLHDPTLSIL